jgi:DNA-binding NtrC family response regulator
MSFNHNPTLAELETELLALQLTRFSRRQALAAETLGIGERSICRMIKRFGLKAE